MFTYMEAEKCHFVSFTLEVYNGNCAKMEARNGIFFAGPSSFSVDKREGDTRTYI